MAESKLINYVAAFGCMHFFYQFSVHFSRASFFLRKLIALRQQIDFGKIVIRLDLEHEIIAQFGMVWESKFMRMVSIMVLVLSLPFVVPNSISVEKNIFLRDF